jgi:hypothetical protein
MVVTMVFLMFLSYLILALQCNMEDKNQPLWLHFLMPPCVTALKKMHSTLCWEHIFETNIDVWGMQKSLAMTVKNN